ncbi:YhgE/Pip family protein [Radiobacillus sp. PE A8.2]|uniref:YhgE/Pip family protein n=1 Tax=Radiobacillus sp. PE A8.2 TaxID=3380349 RepID=UPI0038907E4C
MKNIWQIYKQDWINVSKSPVALFLIIALMILPSLYAWFNLMASWDPYSNTGDIAIAVTNDDTGAVVRGESINVGNEIIESLKGNDKLGWTFVSHEEAERGVKHGDFYASLYIPADFSEKIATILEDNPEKPEIEYSVNEKINAIAPKMTSSGASTIVQEVGSNFVKTVSETVLTIFNDVGIELENELPTIRNMETKVFALEEQLPYLEQIGEKTIALEAKLPEISNQAKKVLELEEMLPQIEEAGDNILLLESKLPMIQEVGENIQTIQEKLPEMERIAAAVVEVDENFSTVKETVSTTLEDMQAAAEIVARAQQVLPNVEQIVADGNTFTNETSRYLEANEQVFASITPVLKQNLMLYEQTATHVLQFATKYQNEQLSEQDAIATIPNLQAELTNSLTSIESNIRLLTQLNNYRNSEQLTAEVAQLEKLGENFQAELQILDEFAASLPAHDSAEVEQLKVYAADAQATASDLVNQYDAVIMPELNSAIEQFSQTAETAVDDLAKAEQMLPEIEAILADTNTALVAATERLQTLENELPEIEEQVHLAATTIATDMDSIKAGINKAADFFVQDFPAVAEKVHRAAAFIQNDLPDAEGEIHNAANVIRNDLPKAEAAVHKLADFIREDFPEFEETVRNAATKIRDFEQDYDFGEIIELLKNDIEAESDFLSNPIELKENKMFPIPNYGSANTPFYTTLSLWVGALLLVSLLTIEVENKENRYRESEMFVGRWLTFITIGIAQALIVSLGDMFILGAYVAAPVRFVLFSLLISLTFMTIVYSLIGIFGNIGKGIAIILLVLQISGSGGTFPIQVTPPFFQAINPFLPFTYAISLLREAVGGIVVSIALKDVLVLSSIFIVIFFVALLLRKPMAARLRKVSEAARKSKLIQ